MEINLAKFRKEVDKSSFLGLGFDHSNEDDRPRNAIVLDLIPLESYHPGYGCIERACLQEYDHTTHIEESQEVMMNKLAAMLRRETDIPDTFLGLGFDCSGNNSKDDDHSDVSENSEMMKLAKRLKETDDTWTTFLGLSIDRLSNYKTEDDHDLGSSNCVERACLGDYDHTTRTEESEEVIMNNMAAMLRKEVDIPANFLGLGFDDSYLFKNSEKMKLAKQNDDDDQDFDTLHKIMITSEDPNGSCVTNGHSGQKRKTPPENNNYVKRQKLIIITETINPPVELVDRIGPTSDGPPVFLYEKKLTESDTKKDQNRLLINNKEKQKLLEFLTEDERIIATCGGAGINFIGIDRTGREFMLRLTKWKTATVFNKEWYKMVEANGAKEEDRVRLWAYRKAGQFCLAVEFHPNQ